MSIEFSTHPDSYRHWQFHVEGDVARLLLNVNEDKGLKEGYKLKLNSYDLSVDIELADAITRIRFEHPEVKAVLIASANEKVFSAGANIFMLGQSSHGFKVNFCKFTNETRLGIEDASANSGIKFLCAAKGIMAGGGYELALACDEIMLVDDSNSAVSLPEVPLLGVLPGTGGLTRLIDKRKVRRDQADFFCTTAEGIKGARAVEWKLVDAIAPKSTFDEAVAHRVGELAKSSTRLPGKGIVLSPISKVRTGNAFAYEYVNMKVDEAKRVAEITIQAPGRDQPQSASDMLKAGAELWALKAYRELDDAILQLRFNFHDIGVIVFRTLGDPLRVLAAEKPLMSLAPNDWFAKEVLLHMKRVLKRIDVTSRSLVTLIEQGSAFAGSLAELAFAADRSYMLDVGNESAALHLSPINNGLLPMGNELSRLQARYFGEPEQLGQVLRASLEGPIGIEACKALGLVTFSLDDIDYEDEVRLFLEERASLSPDALTGMEANLRFVGPETMETKIFARLSAWQNWIFIRDNATGEKGALTNYGKPTRPQFDFERC